MIPRKTEYASKLHAELDYMQAVFRVLLATTRPKGSRPGQPMLSPDEEQEMDLARQMGLAPAGFAARLMTRDRGAVRGAA